MEPNPLLAIVQTELDRLVSPDAALLVGYSGGADSTCLLDLLHQMGRRIVAAHLHHGLRDEAERELKLCQAFCEERGIDFVSGRADTAVIARTLGVGIEEAGRHARYEFFQRAASATQCHCIVTAHTLQDRAETMLLNLTRGTGLKGVSGIPTQRDNIVRPLLKVSRKQTIAYCESHGYWFHEDPYNLDTELPRAKIRHKVLPVLREINPEVLVALERFSELAAEEDQFLDSAAANALGHAELPSSDPLRFLTQDAEFEFNGKILRALPDVLMRRAVRIAAKVLDCELDQRTTHRLCSALQSNESGTEDLSDGVRASWSPELLKFEIIQEEEPFQYNLTVPGETFADSLGWMIEAAHTEPNFSQATHDHMRVVIDPDQVKGQLHFRSARNADKFVPLGMSGHKLVSDALSERKLSRLARRRLPLVCDMVGIVWVPGVALADRVKLSSESRRGLRLTFGAIG